MIVLGRITAPFGVQGWVKVHPYGDDPLSWRRMPQWWLGREPLDSAASWQACRIGECRAHGDGLVVKIEGVEDRTAAEAICGRYVGAPRAALPPTETDEYYWADLVGLAVVTLGGDRLGEVAELVATGANDVLRVVDGEHERLLPFVEQVIRDVDLANRVIRVDWDAAW